MINKYPTEPEIIPRNCPMVIIINGVLPMINAFPKNFRNNSGKEQNAINTGREEKKIIWVDFVTNL